MLYCRRSRSYQGEQTTLDNVHSVKTQTFVVKRYALELGLGLELVFRCKMEEPAGLFTHEVFFWFSNLVRQDIF